MMHSKFMSNKARARLASARAAQARAEATADEAALKHTRAEKLSAAELISEAELSRLGRPDPELWERLADQAAYAYWKAYAMVDATATQQTTRNDPPTTCASP